jgi:hypothetical protein
VRGLLVPLDVADADVAVKDEALVAVAPVDVDDPVDEVLAGVFVALLVVTMIVSEAFVASFMRQDAPSSAHSKPSGQQAFPHVGKGIDVSLTCTGVSGN